MNDGKITWRSATVAKLYRNINKVSRNTEVSSRPSSIVIKFRLTVNFLWIIYLKWEDHASQFLFIKVYAGLD